MTEATIKLRNNTLSRPELDTLSRIFFPLARNIAKRFAPKGAEDDFISAGYFGIAYALANAAKKMYDNDLENWVKSCIYRFVRRHLVTDYLICIPYTTYREARLKGEQIEFLRGHLIGDQIAVPSKAKRHQEMLDNLELSILDETDRKIVALRVTGHVDREIAFTLRKSRLEVFRRRAKIEERFNSLMEKDE